MNEKRIYCDPFYENDIVVPIVTFKYYFVFIQEVRLCHKYDLETYINFSSSQN